MLWVYSKFAKLRCIWVDCNYSLLFNTSHGILIREKWDFPPNPFIPAWSLSKSLLCLLLHPGLKPFLFTWKQWWCHCYINRGLLCSVFQPGLWVNGMACLVIQTCFWKKSGMSPNTTWLVLKRKEYEWHQPQCIVSMLPTAMFIWPKSPAAVHFGLSYNFKKTVEKFCSQWPYLNRMLTYIGPAHSKARRNY